MILKWYGKKVTKEMRKGAEKGLFQGLEYMLDEMNKIVPHNRGDLMRSGKTSQKELKGWISYDTKYAIRLHEHPEYNFQKGRKGKWVEKIIKDEKVKNKVLKHIGNEIKKKLR